MDQPPHRCAAIIIVCTVLGTTLNTPPSACAPAQASASHMHLPLALTSPHSEAPCPTYSLAPPISAFRPQRCSGIGVGSHIMIRPAPLIIPPLSSHPAPRLRHCSGTLVSALTSWTLLAPACPLPQQPNPSRGCPMAGPATPPLSVISVAGGYSAVHCH